MPAASLSPKERARRAVHDLPEDATMEDAIERLIVIHRVEQAREDARSGEGSMTQDELEAHFARRRAERP